SRDNDHAPVRHAVPSIDLIPCAAAQGPHGQVEAKRRNRTEDQRGRWGAWHRVIATFVEFGPTRRAETAAVFPASPADILSGRQHCCAPRHASCTRASPVGVLLLTGWAAMTPGGNR